MVQSMLCTTIIVEFILTFFCVAVIHVGIQLAQNINMELALCGAGFPLTEQGAIVRPASQTQQNMALMCLLEQSRMLTGLKTPKFTSLLKDVEVSGTLIVIPLCTC